MHEIIELKQANIQTTEYKLKWHGPVQRGNKLIYRWLNIN